MSEFHAGEMRSLKEAAVEDSSGTDSCSGKNANRTAGVASRSLVVFRIDPSIDVVADHDAAIKSLAEVLFDMDVSPTEIGGFDKGPGGGVDRSGTSDSDTHELFGAGSGVVECFFNDFDHAGESGGTTFCAFCFLFGAPKRLVIVVVDFCQHLGSTQVESNPDFSWIEFFLGFAHAINSVAIVRASTSALMISSSDG